MTSPHPGLATSLAELRALMVSEVTVEQLLEWVATLTVEMLSGADG